MAAPIALAVDIDTPADTIWEAISTSTGLSSFWTSDSQAEARVGSIAKFGFGAGPKLDMRVDELDPGRRIAWTCLVEFAMTKHWKDNCHLGVDLGERGSHNAAVPTWQLADGLRSSRARLNRVQLGTDPSGSEGLCRVGKAATRLWASTGRGLTVAATGTTPPTMELGRDNAASAAILFVHGAGHGAWCWREHFTSWFEARGFRVSAPDLPSHGELDRNGIKKIPLETYVEVVATLAKSLQPPLILIGHSMGGFLIQKYLETADADLAILLASTPPAGALGMVRRMATRRPLAFLHTMITGEGTDSLNRTREYFFSPETPSSVVKATHLRLQRESSQVLKDMMAALHPERVRTPVVVMGAEHDWLVAPRPDLIATARAFKTDPVTMPGGHDMMLDTAWVQVAVEIECQIHAHVAGADLAVR